MLLTLLSCWWLGGPVRWWELTQGDMHSEPHLQWASELWVWAEVPESPHVQREDSCDKYCIQSNSFPQCVEPRKGSVGSMGFISWLLLTCHSLEKRCQADAPENFLCSSCWKMDILWTELFLQQRYGLFFFFPSKIPRVWILSFSWYILLMPQFKLNL